MTQPLPIARIGFLVNPIAGMGGRVGLKGTDGVAARAAALGARPMAALRAVETLRALHHMLGHSQRRFGIRWLTGSGAMGADCLRRAGFADIEIVHDTREPASADDTRAVAAACRDARVDLILFCGGDGTARDLCTIVGNAVPILGIPSGVKMYSGVFGTNPVRTAEIALQFLEGSLSVAPVEVLDLDEDRYRNGEWVVRLYYSALTPFAPTLTQLAKQLVIERGDDEVKAEIAQYVIEEMTANRETLFLLGPGSSVQAVGTRLAIDKTLLGVDAVAEGALVGKDLDERGVLALLDRYRRRKLILSPLGAQGFVLGRGNLQLSADVVRRIGRRNLIVIATPAKLAVTPILRFDTGDAELDRELVGDGYVPVVVGSGRRRMVKAAI